MTTEEMKARKIELGLTSEMIAEQSGVPLGTVQKIFSGATKAPRKHTIDAIAKVLGQPERKKAFSYASPENRNQGMLRDAAAAYPDLSRRRKDTRYTIEDYYALPEDQRVELIDGFFYDMGAPALVHQSVIGDLYILFRECADRHDKPCDVYLSPCDVRLDMDHYTMVQPDLLVMCRDYDRTAILIEGAPDLVVEVISPATRSRDMILKLYKYQNAGVREYWVIDTKYKEVIVHNFEDEDYTPKKYTFDDRIPIEISKGECEIDFSGINRRLERYGM